MDRYEIAAALRSGVTLVMQQRGSAEQEATLAMLYDRGLVELEQRNGALLIRWKQPKPRRRYLVERWVIAGVDWYGRVVLRRVVVEVEA